MKLTNKTRTNIALTLCALSGMLLHPVNTIIINLTAFIPCIIACIIMAPLIKKEENNMEKDINYWIGKCATLQQELDIAHEKTNVILNKACEWLKKNRNELSRVDTSEFIKLFKKAMGE